MKRKKELSLKERIKKLSELITYAESENFNSMVIEDYRITLKNLLNEQENEKIKIMNKKKAHKGDMAKENNQVNDIALINGGLK